MTDTVAYRTTLRTVVVAALITAAVAHIPVTPEHLEEAPYMGVAFIAFTVAAMLLAGVVALSDRGYLAAAGLCFTAVVVYAATRLVAFPQIGDDVGNWTETLGLVSIAAELVAAIAAVAADRRLTLGRVLELLQGGAGVVRPGRGTVG
jgi:hypothetical protein